MLRAVIDPGVLISGLISPSGAPAQLLRRWIDGEFQIVWSPALLHEFSAVCARDRFREWFSVTEAERIASVIRDCGEARDDVQSGALTSPDPGDQYLVDLLEISGADFLVTGDAALLAHPLPSKRAVSPRRFNDILDELDAG